MRVAVLLVLFCAFCAGPAFAGPVRKAILFGGSCDVPETGRNIFLSDVAEEATALMQSGWDVTDLFGGVTARCLIRSSAPECGGKTPSSSCCPAGIAPGDPAWSIRTLATATKVSASQIHEASKAELLRALDQATRLASGSELLLSFDTHGSPRDQGGAHALCLSDGSLLRVDDPELLRRLDQIKRAGIRIGVIDSSCFSGDSIRVFSKYGCVLAAQVDNRPSAGGGPVSKIKPVIEASKNPSLEQVFIEDLLSNTTSSGALLGTEPQISGYDRLDSFDKVAARLEVDLTNDPTSAYWSALSDQFTGTACRTPENDLEDLSRFLKSLQSELASSALWKRLPWKEKPYSALLGEVRRDDVRLRALRDELKADTEKQNQLTLETSLVPYPFAFVLDPALHGHESELSHAIATFLALPHRSTGDLASNVDDPFKAGRMDSHQMRLLSNSGTSINFRPEDYAAASDFTVQILKKNGFQSKLADSDLRKAVARTISNSIKSALQHGQKSEAKLKALVTRINELENRDSKIQTEIGVLKVRMQVEISKVQLFEYLRDRQRKGGVLEMDPLHPESPASGALRACSDFKLVGS